MKRSVMVLLLTLAAGCAPVHHDHSIFHNELSRLKTQNDIVAVGNRLFICTDNRDWSCVRDVFAPEVLFDMTSLSGGKPGTNTPQQIADMWEQGLKALKAIHHQAGNYRVTVNGNEADLFCYGIAYHYLPNLTEENTRIFVGSYDLHLAKGEGGWKIDRFKFNLKFIDGNKELERSLKKDM